MLIQDDHTLRTSGRGTYDLTAEIDDRLRAAGVVDGLCTVFVHHTSASLIVCENADPEVRRDLERWLSRAIPDGDRLFRHTAEGPDDMPAHVRSTLTATSLSIPVTRGRLDLGTWQSVYLYEHRTAAHARRISLTVVG